MKNTDTQQIKQDIADWMGITVEQLEARIAAHREAKRVTAIAKLASWNQTWHVKK